MHESMARRTDREFGMESSGEPFMVPSGRGLGRIKGGGRGERWSLAPGVFLKVVVLCREVALQSAFMVNSEMAGHNPLSKERSQEGYHCNWCRGGHGVGGSGKEVVEN